MDASEMLIAFFLGGDGFCCVGFIVVAAVLAASTQRAARRCPGCREINREAAIFCAQCGARLPGR